MVRGLPMSPELLQAPFILRWRCFAAMLLARDNAARHAFALRRVWESCLYRFVCTGPADIDYFRGPL